ncbi:hypothetical protein MNEG_0031 [Monoraphidium neglectum]|uniref:Uncharacterized protein n=1 Tax=Monoraphidium neglectum TaxID=145388 RepID=A0A0D2LNQ9_9CHLO|nr:hypothetical protein MNEG_0031 [Monoraphidium neglectum]KIZ07914.1 hypothetical protein MNEG_0031 [Monoraphidium neglectum]|eukprot:XP_013906933.1 hypothetical protein MNEG_0031 [Monoraphidium neglectum]
MQRSTLALLLVAGLLVAADAAAPNEVSTKPSAAASTVCATAANASEPRRSASAQLPTTHVGGAMKASEPQAAAKATPKPSPSPAATATPQGRLLLSQAASADANPHAARTEMTAGRRLFQSLQSLSSAPSHDPPDYYPHNRPNNHPQHHYGGHLRASWFSA